jgi:hypothetical protein
MNFLMCLFASHNSLCLGLSLSNTSLCSPKYSDTMNIRCNTCVGVFCTDKNRWLGSHILVPR